MSELFSCYFCGTALDAPVRRYPLTPSDIDVDTGRTVALCPPCRRKLGNVLTLVAEEMAATPADQESDPVAPTTEEETGGGADETTGEDAGDDAVEGESDDNEAGAVEDIDADTGEELEADAAGGADDAGVAETASNSASTQSDESVEWDTPEDDAEDEPATADWEGADQSSADTESVEVESGDPEATQDSGDEGSVASGQSAGERQSDGQSAGAAGGNGGGGPPEVLSTPSAKKVVRLLLNREFPVEREEFEVIVQNAYDIPLQDCQEIVDALIEEGYVGQEGGQLVREE